MSNNYIQIFKTFKEQNKDAIYDASEIGSCIETCLVEHKFRQSRIEDIANKDYEDLLQMRAETDIQN